MTRVALLALALAVAGPALGQGVDLAPPTQDTERLVPTDIQTLSALERPRESPRYGSFQFSFSGYRPSIDSEFNGAASPYGTVFGGGRNVMFRADVAYSLLAGNHGALDVGIGAGYWNKTGKGRLPNCDPTVSNCVSSDDTSLKILPTRLSLTYRFEWLSNNYPIPLAPYARVSLDRYWWWVTNGSGSTANAAGKSGSGATNGYSITGGVALLLDFIDRKLAREMDRDTGINHTYLFGELTKSYVDDFGSKSSWNLSDDRVTISGGLLFEF